MKLKILGMALLAVAATSALAVTNASGTANGHFVHHGATNNAIITGHDAEGTAHQLEFFHLKPGTHETDTTEPITCETSRYDGVVNAKTVTSIQLFPVYTNCTTTDNVGVTVHPEHCSYTFSSQGAREHGTVNIDCPPNQSIKITHPNCTIVIPPQTTAATLTQGISYTAKEEGGKKTLTADVTVKTITGYYEEKICIFLGTPQKFEMIGNVTVKGYNWISGTGTDHNLVEGAQIDITST